jgi:hypothetical protein
MRHLDWIRTQPCVVEHCWMRAEAHHVRSAANAGTGMKPEDRWAVPLCAVHHAQVHHRGRLAFELDHKLDLAALAVWHWETSGSTMP